MQFLFLKCPVFGVKSKVFSMQLVGKSTIFLIVPSSRSIDEGTYMKMEECPLCEGIVFIISCGGHIGRGGDNGVGGKCIFYF